MKNFKLKMYDALRVVLLTAVVFIFFPLVFAAMILFGFKLNLSK
jgi:hypothetical protein